MFCWVHCMRRTNLCWKSRRRVWSQWRWRLPRYMDRQWNAWMSSCYCASLHAVEEKINIKRIRCIVSYVCSIINRAVLKNDELTCIFTSASCPVLSSSDRLEEATMDLDLVCWPNSHIRCLLYSHGCWRSITCLDLYWDTTSIALTAHINATYSTRLDTTTHLNSFDEATKWKHKNVDVGGVMF